MVWPNNKEEAQAEVAYWFGADWQYRKEITINHSYVTEDVDGFVLLVSEASDDDLRDNAQADGGDIVFAASDGVTELPYQFEKYDNATGEIVAWVKVPEIFGTTDTKVYMYYGNATCENQEDAEAVWTNGEAAVWHLEETGVSSRFDSTVNNNDGSPFGGITNVAGMIENGNICDGNDDYVNFGNAESLNRSYITVSAWINKSETDTFANFLDQDISNEHQRHWQFRVDNSNKAGFIVFKSYTDYKVLTGTSDVADGDWHFITGTWDGNTVKLYVDGLLEDIEAYSGTLEDILSELVKLCMREGYYSEGMVDEARIYDRAINAGNVYAQFVNQSTPSSFYSISGAMEVDTTAPENVSEVFGYSGSGKTIPISFDSTYGYTAPYFEWEAPDEPDGVVAGYYVYFGTNVNADPVYDGVFQEGNSFIPSYLVSGQTYYLIITTRNLSPTNYLSDSKVFFIYEYIEDESEVYLTDLPKTGR